MIAIALRVLLITVLFIPIALFVIGLFTFGDCPDQATVGTCVKEGQTSALIAVIIGAITYGVLIKSLVRSRPKDNR